MKKKTKKLDLTLTLNSDFFSSNNLNKKIADETDNRVHLIALLSIAPKLGASVTSMIISIKNFSIEKLSNFNIIVYILYK